MSVARRKGMLAGVVLQLMLLAAPLRAQEGVEKLFPAQPTGYLTDVAGVVDPASAARIENIARTLREKTGAELAVVTLPTLGRFEASDVALVIGRRWGVGAKGSRSATRSATPASSCCSCPGARASRARSVSKSATACRESSPTPPRAAFATRCVRSSRPASMDRASSPASRPSPRWWRRISACATRRWCRRRPLRRRGRARRSSWSCC